MKDNPTIHPRPHTLVLGIGNDILMDDGIGIRLVRELQEQNTRQEIAFKTCMLGGFDVLDLIVGYRQVVILDAIKTVEGVPGDVYHMAPGDFKETLHLSNIHDISFLNALKIGKKLNLEVPQKIDIIAIEIIEDRVFGREFTPRLQARYPEIKKQVQKLFNDLLRD